MNSLVNFKALGDIKNPSIFILHGLFGSLDNWQSLAKRWSESFHVIILDLRNHGKSFHSENMDFESLANDIKNLASHLNISKFHLLGHSLGGKIAMEYAQKYPLDILSLIIVDVAPFSYQAKHNEVLEILRNIDLKEFSTRKNIEYAISRYIDEESVIQFLMKNIRRVEDESIFTWKFNASVLVREYLKLIQYVPKNGFSGRTLFIGGDKSKYISKETSIHLFDLYPNAELEFISNAGHWVHADNPEEFYNKINLFLNKV